MLKNTLLIVGVISVLSGCKENLTVEGATCEESSNTCAINYTVDDFKNGTTLQINYKGNVPITADCRNVKYKANDDYILVKKGEDITNSVGGVCTSSPQSTSGYIRFSNIRPVVDNFKITLTSNKKVRVVNIVIKNKISEENKVKIIKQNLADGAPVTSEDIKVPTTLLGEEFDMSTSHNSPDSEVSSVVKLKRNLFASSMIVSGFAPPERTEEKATWSKRTLHPITNPTEDHTSVGINWLIPSSVAAD